MEIELDVDQINQKILKEMYEIKKYKNNEEGKIELILQKWKFENPYMFVLNKTNLSYRKVLEDDNTDTEIRYEDKGTVINDEDIKGHGILIFYIHELYLELYPKEQKFNLSKDDYEFIKNIIFEIYNSGIVNHIFKEDKTYKLELNDKNVIFKNRDKKILEFKIFQYNPSNFHYYNIKFEDENDKKTLFKLLKEININLKQPQQLQKKGIFSKIKKIFLPPKNLIDNYDEINDTYSIELYKKIYKPIISNDNDNDKENLCKFKIIQVKKQFNYKNSTFKENKVYIIGDYKGKLENHLIDLMDQEVKIFKLYNAIYIIIAKYDEIYYIKDFSKATGDFIKNFINKFNTITQGGNKTKQQKYKKTDKKVKYKSREYVIYVGKRGGKYIKINKEYTNLKQLITKK